MKFIAATSLLFAALALAGPAPLANPDAVAKPIPIESREQFRKALSARNALTMPNIQLEERASSGKGGKGGKGGSGSGNSTSAASDMISPNRVLQATALGLGVVEVARLWV